MPINQVTPAAETSSAQSATNNMTQQAVNNINNLLDSANKEAYKIFANRDFDPAPFHANAEQIAKLIQGNESKLVENLFIHAPEKLHNIIIRNVNIAFPTKFSMPNPISKNLQDAGMSFEILQTLLGPNPNEIFNGKEIDPAPFVKFPNLVRAKLAGKEEQVVENLIRNLKANLPKDSSGEQLQKQLNDQAEHITRALNAMIAHPMDTDNPLKKIALKFNELVIEGNLMIAVNSNLPKDTSTPSAANNMTQQVVNNIKNLLDPANGEVYKIFANVHFDPAPFHANAKQVAELIQGNETKLAENLLMHAPEKLHNTIMRNVGIALRGNFSTPKLISKNLQDAAMSFDNLETLLGSNPNEVFNGKEIDPAPFVKFPNLVRSKLMGYEDQVAAKLISNLEANLPKDASGGQLQKQFNDQARPITRALNAMIVNPMDKNNPLAKIAASFNQSVATKMDEFAAQSEKAQKTASTSSAPNEAQPKATATPVSVGRSRHTQFAAPQPTTSSAPEKEEKKHHRCMPCAVL